MLVSNLHYSQWRSGQWNLENDVARHEVG